MLRRFIYIFIIIIGSFVLSFISREFISEQRHEYNDAICVYREFRAYAVQADKAVGADIYPDIQGGLVIDHATGFDHRYFYVTLYDDHVAVFNRYGSLCFPTGIVKDSIDIRLRKLLEKGLYFYELGDATNFVNSL